MDNFTFITATMKLSSVTIYYWVLHCLVEVKRPRLAMLNRKNYLPQVPQL